MLNCKEEATMKNKTFMRVFLLFIMIVAVSLIGFSKKEALENGAFIKKSPDLFLDQLA